MLKNIAVNQAIERCEGWDLEGRILDITLQHLIQNMAGFCGGLGPGPDARVPHPGVASFEGCAKSTAAAADLKDCLGRQWNAVQQVPVDPLEVVGLCQDEA